MNIMPKQSQSFKDVNKAKLIILGQNIRKYREPILTQEKLAFAAGLTTNYVSNLERGLCNITIGHLCKIAEVLNVPIAYLVEGMN